MTSQPLVSIVIPACNSADTLEKCLKSIENQSYPNIEILLIESKKSHKTLEIAHKYHCSVFCLYKQNRTVATNVGIKMANGKYIHKVDSDLVLDPNLILEAVDKCEKENYDAISVSCPPDPHMSFWAKVRVLEKDCYNHHIFHYGANFFRKDIIQVIGDLNESMVLGEYYDFYNRLVRANFTVGMIDSQKIHIEEPKSLKEIFVKQFHYGQTLEEFFKVNRGVGLVQMSPLGKPHLKSCKKFAQTPLLTLGYIIYSFIYYSSSISGFIVAMLKN